MPNASAALMRTVIDFIATEYCEKKLNNPKLPQLHEKLKHIAEDLVNKSLIDRTTKNVVEKVCGIQENLVSVKGLQFYIHNVEITPGPADLQSLWDNLENLLERACNELWP